MFTSLSLLYFRDITLFFHNIVFLRRKTSILYVRCMQLMLYIRCIFILSPPYLLTTKDELGISCSSVVLLRSNKRSPASPRPGTTYPWSFNFSSNLYININIRMFFLYYFYPSGAATIHINLICFAPRFSES